ncbi:MAG: hypothetical protein DRG87_08805 [Deltaproteobacteria bacterium]|nr:MAG: hypothetical protein DRG87_08805 [Deltaproteobacteria bacterium]
MSEKPAFRYGSHYKDGERVPHSRGAVALKAPIGSLSVPLPGLSFASTIKLSSTWEEPDH